MEKPANWIEYRPQRFLQLHSFNAFLQPLTNIRLDRMLVCLASFGGPIALTANPAKQLNIYEQTAINKVLIFSNSGTLKNTVSFQQKERIVGFFFIEDERICLFFESGVYLLISPSRNLSRTYNLGPKYNTLSAKVLGNNIFFLSRNKFFTIDNPYQPVPKDYMTTEYKISVWCISERQGLVFGSGSKTFTFKDNQQSQLPIEAHVIEISVELKNGNILLLAQGMIIYVDGLDYKKHKKLVCASILKGPPLSHSRKYKDSPYQIAWIDNLTALVVSPKFNCIVDEYSYGELELEGDGFAISSEIDGARVVGKQNAIFRKVSTYYFNCLKASLIENPGQILYTAFEEYLEGRPKKLILMAEKPQLFQTSFLECIEAASFSLQPQVQTRLLKAASFANNYWGCKCDQSRLQYVCKILRGMNSLRYAGLGRCITFQQLQYLSLKRPKQLLKILERYRLHYIACQLFKLLGMPQSYLLEVYSHWASCKLETSQKHQIILQKVRQKFSKIDNPPYTSVARRAFMLNKYDMALKLLELEPSKPRSITVLLWMAEHYPASSQEYLLKAIQLVGFTNNTDFYQTVLKKTIAIGSQKILVQPMKQPDIRAFFIRLLRKEDLAILQRLLKKEKSNEQLARQYLRLYLQCQEADRKKLLLTNCLHFYQLQKNYKQVTYQLRKQLQPENCVPEKNSPFEYLKTLTKAINEHKWDCYDKQLEEKPPDKTMLELVVNKLKEVGGQNQRMKRTIMKMQEEKCFKYLLKYSFISQALQQAKAKMDTKKIQEVRAFAESKGLSIRLD